MTGVSEVIRGWLGWCPDARAIQTSSARMSGLASTNIVSPPGVGRERIRRGVHLMKGSWKILMNDKTLLWFSFFWGLALALFIASFALQYFLGMGIFSGNLPIPTQKFVVWLGLTFFLGGLLMAYTLTGMIFSVYAKLEGQPISVRESFFKATGTVRSTISWISVVAAGYTLSFVIINIFANTVSVLAVAAIILIVLSIATMYVIPVLVLEGTDLITALQESLSMFKKTWCETVIGVGIIVLIYLVLETGGIFMIAFFSQNLQVLWLGLAVLFLALGVFITIAGTVNGIFLMGLYSYAKSDKIPAIFEGM
jgi:hypothetical protein